MDVTQPAAKSPALVRPPTTQAARRRTPLPSWVNWASPVAFVICWQVAAQCNIVDRRIIAPPTEIVATLVTMFAREDFLSQCEVTLLRFAAGLTVGTILGLAIGLTTGLFRWPRAFVQPLVSIFYPLPHIALFPIVLILVGQNERSNLIMIALGPFFSMLIVTQNAVRTIDPIFMDVAASFRTNVRDLYLRIVLPAVLPAVLAGFRVALGLALVATIAVEFLVAENGVGHVIWNSWQILSLSRSVGGLTVTGIFGAVMYFALARLERRMIPWGAGTT